MHAIYYRSKVLSSDCPHCLLHAWLCTSRGRDPTLRGYEDTRIVVCPEFSVTLGQRRKLVHYIGLSRVFDRCERALRRSSVVRVSWFGKFVFTGLRKFAPVVRFHISLLPPTWVAVSDSRVTCVTSIRQHRSLAQLYSYLFFGPLPPCVDSAGCEGTTCGDWTLLKAAPICSPLIRWRTCERSISRTNTRSSP